MFDLLGTSRGQKLHSLPPCDEVVVESEDEVLSSPWRCSAAQDIFLMHFGNNNQPDILQRRECRCSGTNDLCQPVSEMCSPGMRAH